MNDTAPTQVNMIQRLLGYLCTSAKKPISSSEYIVHTLAYLGMAMLTLWPVATFYRTLSVVVQEFYWVVAVALAILAFVGFCVSYFRALNGKGAHWAWGVFGLLSPLIIGYLSSAYIDYRSQSSDYYPSGDLNVAASWFALALFFSLPLVVRGKKLQPASAGIEHPPVWLNHFPLYGLGASILTVALAAVYAGHFQSGIWVGREGYNGYVSLPVDGHSYLLHCENFAGVAAQTNNGTPTGSDGFSRDLIDDGSIAFTYKDDGELEIVLSNQANESELSNDYGYAIQAWGLERRQDDQSELFEFRALTHAFVIRAVNRTGTAFYTFGFSRHSDRFVNKWQVVMTELRSHRFLPEEVQSSREAFPLYTPNSYSVGRLLVGDCETGSLIVDAD